MKISKLEYIEEKPFNGKNAKSITTYSEGKYTYYCQNVVGLANTFNLLENPEATKYDYNDKFNVSFWLRSNKDIPEKQSQLEKEIARVEKIRLFFNGVFWRCKKFRRLWCYIV